MSGPRVARREATVVHRWDKQESDEDAHWLLDTFADVLALAGGPAAVAREALRLEADETVTRNNFREVAREIAERIEVNPSHALDFGASPTVPLLECEPCVYFIRCGSHVKIGTTMRGARHRFISMQLPPDAELVGEIQGWGADKESALHLLFAEYRARGEWFRSCPELEAIIAANPYSTQ